MAELGKISFSRYGILGIGWALFVLSMMLPFAENRSGWQLFGQMLVFAYPFFYDMNRVDEFAFYVPIPLINLLAWFTPLFANRLTFRNVRAVSLLLAAGGVYAVVFVMFVPMPPWTEPLMERFYIGWAVWPLALFVMAGGVLISGLNVLAIDVKACPACEADLSDLQVNDAFYCPQCQHAIFPTVVWGWRAIRHPRRKIKGAPPPPPPPSISPPPQPAAPQRDAQPEPPPA